MIQSDNGRKPTLQDKIEEAATGIIDTTQNNIAATSRARGILESEYAL